MDVELVLVAGLGKARHARAEAAVDADGQVVVLGRRPDAVHLVGEQLHPVIPLGPERDAGQPGIRHFFDHRDRSVNRLQRADAHTEEPVRVFRAEVGHPAVVGTGILDGDVWVVDVARDQHERREHQRRVEALVVHHRQASGRVVAAGHDVVPGDVGAIGVRDAGRRDAVAQPLALDEHGIAAVTHDPALRDQIPVLGIGVLLPHRRRLGDVRVRVVDRHCPI